MWQSVSDKNDLCAHTVENRPRTHPPAHLTRSIRQFSAVCLMRQSNSGQPGTDAAVTQVTTSLVPHRTRFGKIVERSETSATDLDKAQFVIPEVHVVPLLCPHSKAFPNRSLLSLGAEPDSDFSLI